MRCPLSAIAAVLLCAVLTAAAAEGDRPVDQVYITAERLLVDTTGRWAEFTGTVRAEQGTTVIEADKIKVFYTRQDSASEPPPGTSAAGGGQIERIEASGRVMIHFDQRVAESDQALYTTTDRILVLTGRPARVTEGANTVSGGRIVMDRDKNQIAVEKPDEGSVEAIFFTDDQGLK